MIGDGMKLAITTLLISAATWFVFADEEKKPVIVSGPSVWSRSIEAFAVNGGEPAAVKSMMTADKEINVTRIEVFDEQGPRLNVSGINAPFVPCSPQPAITITDGLTTYTLPLSSGFLPKSAATFTDSGRLNLRFVADARISLMVVPPQTRQSALCMAKQMNVLVHYMSISR
jgi:hypothetical protein